MRIKATHAMRTETGHRLIGIEGSFSNLHGHSFLWEVTISKDFSIQKGIGDGVDVGTELVRQVMHEVIGPFDHAFILNEKDPLLSGSFSLSSEIFSDGNGGKARILLLPYNPTPENILAFVFEGLTHAFKLREVDLDSVKLFETAESHVKITT